MQNRTITIIALLAAALSTTPIRAQQATVGSPQATYLRRAHAAAMKDLAAIIEIMPQEDFGFRPAGAVSAVRTFGEIVHHMVVVASWVCSAASGTPDSVAALGSTQVVDKTRLLGLVNHANMQCDAYLSTLTDSTLGQVVISGSPPAQMQMIRGSAVVFAIAHLNEHYGNLVTYVRAKGLVPPNAPAQVAPFSRYSPPSP